MRTLEQDTRTVRRISTAVVNADGSINNGTGFTVTKTGTGAYTIRFQGYRALTGATCSLGAGVGVTVVSVTQPNTVTVNIYTMASVAVDVAFYLTVDGLAR